MVEPVVGAEQDGIVGRVRIDGRVKRKLQAVVVLAGQEAVVSVNGREAELLRRVQVLVVGDHDCRCLDLLTCERVAGSPQLLEADPGQAQAAVRGDAEPEVHEVSLSTRTRHSQPSKAAPTWPGSRY